MIEQKIHPKSPELHALRRLLEHPAFIVKQLSVEVYDDHSPAAYERLRSRMIGRHRFQKVECQKLHELFAKISRQLRKKSTSLPKQLNANNRSKSSPIEILEHPILNMKALLDPIAAKHEKTYHQVYDALRRRAQFTPELCKDITILLNKLANLVDAELERSKAEARNYKFREDNGS